MSNSIFSKLSWLPQAPADFAARCRALHELKDNVSLGANLGDHMQALAFYALDENQLHRVAKLIDTFLNAGDSLAPLTPFRLGVLTNSMFDLVLPAISGSAARHGIALTCVAGGYDQVLQDALSADSKINRSKPDAVLVAIDYRAVQVAGALGNTEHIGTAVESARKYVETIRSGIKANTGAICILQSFAPPPERLFGSFDRMLPGTLLYILDRLNIAVTDMIRGSEDILLDVAGIAGTVGLADWHSPEQWNLAKLPFSNRLLPLYADHVARLLGAICGKSRRCLVLDLDNMLWGGVIGDDGVEGIQCAQGTATGEAYLSVQRLALQLRERGILLAVSSKNNDQTARLPFRHHPEMLLKEEHIAVFQANWNDKADNLQAIAEKLSLGLDSLVLLDDDPFERGLVRQLLPQVAVPELPADPALYARTLAAAGYFESVALSNEDICRARYYQDNARRVALRKGIDDVDAYLASLNMEITLQPFHATSRARIAQLINKSNQYNLTTRRCTEQEIAEMESDPDYFTMQVRLADVFGDNGMIGAVICERNSRDEWYIVTWIISCRVLGRRVENAVLQELLTQARRQGIRKLIGIYKPTGRNQAAEQHYLKLGFTELSRLEDGSTTWILDVESATPGDIPMNIRRIGFNTPQQV